MDNQYFTPSIEDIRVGYECEIYEQATTKLIKDIKWHLVKVVAGNPEYGEGAAFLKIPAYIKKEKIRVPYLTKEQIEAEGWIMKETVKSDNSYEFCSYNVFVKPTKLKEDCMDCFEYSYRLFCEDLTPFGQSYYQDIIIEKRTTGGFIGVDKTQTSYSGQCKDINTFRYICKLLNIS